MKPFPCILALCVSAVVVPPLSAESTLPTAIKYLDGSVTLIGFDPTGKERTVKIAWDDLKNAKPILVEPGRLVLQSTADEDDTRLKLPLRLADAPR